MRGYVGSADTFKTKSNRRRKTAAGRIKRFESKNTPRAVAEALVREESL